MVEYSVSTWAVWATTASASTSTNYWPTWVSSTATSGYSVNAVNGAAVTVTLQGVRGRISDARAEWTPEQFEEARLTALREAEERVAAAEAHMAERAAALTRATETLRTFLTPDQLAEFDAAGQFHVRDQGGHRYLIRPLVADSIVEYQGAAPAAVWCVHEPGSHLPAPDRMLAQKLAIECGDAAELRTIANRRPYRRGDLSVRRMELAA